VITVNSGTICSGNSFTITPGGAVTYTYSNGNPVATPTTITDYTVTGTDANSCVGTGTTVVVVNPSPVLAVNSPSVCYGSTAVLTTTVTTAGTPPYIYGWSNGGTTYSTSVSPLANTQYSVNLADANGCTTSTVSSVTILVNDDISGAIYDTTTVSGVQPVMHGTVYLYAQQSASTAIDTTGILSNVISTPVTAGGLYNFSQVAAGNYYIKAEADTHYYHGAVATYL